MRRRKQNWSRAWSEESFKRNRYQEATIAVRIGQMKAGGTLHETIRSESMNSDTASEIVKALLDGYEITLDFMPPVTIKRVRKF